MTSRPDDDPPRDAHLLAALRHAPDRDAKPPPEVTDRILAAARAAVRPSPSPSPSSAAVPTLLHRLWAGLARPAVGAAFGTLVVAVMVGMLWSTREPRVTGEPAPTAGSNAAHEPPLPTSAPTPARAEASERNAGSVAQEAAPLAPAATAPPPAARSQSAKTAAAPRTESAPAPAPIPGAAPAPVRPEPPPLERRSDAAAPTARPEVDNAASERPRSRLAQERAATAAEAAADTAHAAAPVPSTLGAGMSTRDPLAGLQPQAIGGSWRVAGVNGDRPHAAPQQAWWESLRQGTQGRWQRAVPPSPVAPWVTLLRRDGGVAATFGWADDGTLWLTDAQGASWRASPSPSVREEWQQSVSRW